MWCVSGRSTGNCTTTQMHHPHSDSLSNVCTLKRGGRNKRNLMQSGLKKIHICFFQLLNASLPSPPQCSMSRGDALLCVVLV